MKTIEEIVKLIKEKEWLYSHLTDFQGIDARLKGLSLSAVKKLLEN